MRWAKEGNRIMGVIETRMKHFNGGCNDQIVQVGGEGGTC